MSDRRETPANGRVAHVSLRGTVEAARYTEGEGHEVAVPVTMIRAEPDGARDRELLLGDAFLVLEERDAWAFGVAARDGYVGYLAAADLGALSGADHVVSAIRSYAKPTPALKKTEPVTYLPFGARVAAGRREGDWTEIRAGTVPLWMPTGHLKAVSELESDPVAVAAAFMGTPYLWGGNSAFGIDCSGLIQAAMLACGIPCPGDSDQQAAQLGEEIGAEEPRLRGDLWFWNGHVGILSTPDTLLHANAHRMAVTEEPLEGAIARIAAAEGKGVLCRRRVIPPTG